MITDERIDDKACYNAYETASAKKIKANRVLIEIFIAHKLSEIKEKVKRKNFLLLTPFSGKCIVKKFINLRREGDKRKEAPNGKV